MIDQVAAHSKWLTASLLAINGGGSLATLAAIKTGSSGFSPGVLFLSGLVAALLSGTGLQEIYNRASSQFDDAYDYWTRVLYGSDRDIAREKDSSIKSERLHRWDRVPPIIGWISGMLFVAGSVALALNVSPAASAHAVSLNKSDNS